MKISEAKFVRRYNVGQYEHEEYSLTAVVEDDDKAVEVLMKLKKDVAAAYSGVCEDEASEPEQDPQDTVPVEQPEEEEEEQDIFDGEEETEDTEDEEEVEEPAPAKKSKATPTKAGAKTGSGSPAKKNLKKKPPTYSRSNETHKELFSDVLKGVAPDWKKSAVTKAKAKVVSMDMEGEEFLDEDGNVLPAFKQAVKKLMGKK